MENAKKCQKILKDEEEYVAVKNYGDKDPNLRKQDEDIGSSNVVKDR